MTDHRILAGHLHQFMAALMEAASAAHGNTVLYIPEEDLQDAGAAAQDHALVQRLDSVVVHWTRQITDLVHRQSSVASGSSGGQKYCFPRFETPGRIDSVFNTSCAAVNN